MYHGIPMIRIITSWTKLRGIDVMSRSVCLVKKDKCDLYSVDKYTNDFLVSRGVEPKITRIQSDKFKDHYLVEFEPINYVRYEHWIKLICR